MGAGAEEGRHGRSRWRDDEPVWRISGEHIERPGIRSGGRPVSALTVADGTDRKEVWRFRSTPDGSDRRRSDCANGSRTMARHEMEYEFRSRQFRISARHGRSRCSSPAARVAGQRVHLGTRRGYPIIFRFDRSRASFGETRAMSGTDVANPGMGRIVDSYVRVGWRRAVAGDARRASGIAAFADSVELLPARAGRAAAVVEDPIHSIRR